ncbi:Cystathionine, partial [Perkinsus olseni]
IQMQTVKTLELRIQRQSETAMKICKFLEGHPKCSRVIYPGLKSHPQHELAKKLHRNNLHGGMLWFDVVGGSDSGTKLMNSIQRPWSLCENLGATESIITACAVMTHANMLPEDRLRLGIVDGFIRVSVGVEDADDLIRSLKDSLDQL